MTPSLQFRTGTNQMTEQAVIKTTQTDVEETNAYMKRARNQEMI